MFLNASGAEIALGPTNARTYMGIGWPIMKYATNRLFSDPDTRTRKSTWSNDRRLCNILALIRLAMAHALDRRNSANENEKAKTANMLKGCGRADPALYDMPRGTRKSMMGGGRVFEVVAHAARCDRACLPDR